MRYRPALLSETEARRLCRAVYSSTSSAARLALSSLGLALRLAEFRVVVILLRAA